MLAQNFMRPTSLGVNDVEFESLVRVLGMLERGEIESRLFDMAHVGNPQCGSPGCIIGWVKTLPGTERFASDRLFTGGLSELVQMRTGVSPGQAAIALRNFLTSGEPRWSEALASA
jgi:hypothetical protein